MLEAEPQSLSGVVIQCEASRWWARGKAKGHRQESFQCAEETRQNSSAWPGGQGEYGTKRAVKVYVHIKQEWTAKPFSPMLVL